MNGLVTDQNTDESPLDPGVTLLVDGERSTAPHRLVLAQQRCTRGKVLWVDARDTASTYALYRLTEDDQLLAGVEIARAWTAYQHHTLVRSLVDRTTPRTRLLVLPNVCSLYRDADLDAVVAEQLLTATLETLAEIARITTTRVLLSAPPDERSTLAPYIDATLRQRTGGGLHDSGPVRPTDRGWLQTTIPDWIQRFGERHETDPLTEHRASISQTILGPQQSF